MLALVCGRDSGDTRYQVTMICNFECIHVETVGGVRVDSVVAAW